MANEMAMMMNWLLVAAGLLASDMFSGLWDGSWFDDDDPTEDTETSLGDNIGLGLLDEDYVGTDYDDTVRGQAGDDSIAGADGDDSIEGNTGDDFITGDAGDDIIAGGGDTDTMFGGDGDDVLSSDRTDTASDWSRGDSEVLYGGDGDDALMFSSEDVATGGAGNDTFGMVHTGQGAAHITDFDPAEDNVTIYVDGLSEGATLPIVNYEANTDTGQTTLSLDGEAALVFDGVFTAEELGVTLEDPDQITFTAPTS